LASVSPADELAVIEECEAVFILDCGGTLGVVNLAGGAPRGVAAHVSYADWSPDSKQLAIVVDAANDARLEFPPGHVLYRQNSGWLGHPRFSPDGTLIAFENHPVDSDDGTIDVVDLQGHRRIISRGWISLEGLAWHPDGKEIWFAGTINTGGWADAIHAVALSGKERTVLTLPWLRLHDISKDGRVLLSRENWRGQAFGMFPKDTAEHPYSWLDATNPQSLSNDGQWLSFNESGEIFFIAGDRQAYYRRTDGSPAVSLGPGVADVSPDGKWILIYGRKNILQLQPVGPGAPKDLPTPGITMVDHGSWADDGLHIVYEGLTTQNEWNVYIQTLDGTLPHLVSSRGHDSLPTPSPDGTTVALRQEGGGIMLYREGSKQPAELKGALASELPIRFVNGGKSLLVQETRGEVTTLSLIDLANGHRQMWKRLRLMGGGQGKRVATTPDLKYYAYSLQRYASSLYLVENLR